MALRPCISSEDQLESPESLLFEGEPDQATLFPFGHDPHSCVDKQLRAVQAIQNLLKQRQSAFVSSAMYHRSQLSPICLLPDEILIDTFQEMNADKYRNGGSTTFDMQKIPWVLTHVCRRWGWIVISAPSMWTNTNVTIISNSSIKFSFPPYGALDLLRLRLDRSQSYPLDVKFHFDTVVKKLKDSPKRPWNPSTLFHPLLDHGDRIRHFDVYVNDSEPAVFHDVQVHALRFPQLLTLRFHDNGRGWLFDAITITASQLVKLDIYPYHFRRMLALPQLTTLYSHLTVLFLGSEKYFARTPLALRALAAMPNLEQCVLYLDRVRLYDSEMQHDATFLPTSIIMKVLFSLEVYGYIYVDMGGLFSPLSLPSLEILKLNIRSKPPLISQLIKRSECCISTLVIQVLKNDFGDLRSMLEHMPVLNCLTICLDRVCDER